MQIQLQNGEGEELNSINLIQEYIFKKTHIVFDTLKPSFKHPEIKIIQSPYDLTELRSLGICMYSVPVKKGQTWSPRQKSKYYLRDIDLPSDTDSKEINKLPANHILENDIANNQIRLTGRLISKDTNKTEWFKY